MACVGSHWKRETPLLPSLQVGTAGGSRDVTNGPGRSKDLESEI